MAEQRKPRIICIPGDGIGHEVIPAALAVLAAGGFDGRIVEAEAGWECFQRTGSALPPATLAAAREADAILFGAVASPSYPVAGYRSPIVALRRELDLYTNIRPVKSLPHQPAVDLVVVRENTEGLYAGRERVEDGGATAVAERVITRRASERIVRAAFELARARQTAHQLVTIVHKANVLRETCGLFRRVALEVARDYPEIAHEELLVDTCALRLVQRPQHFDVVVTTNLFGDILSDVASFWGGGLGLAASANLGAQAALFEPVHGAAPDIAGQGVANPLAAITCAALLLDHLGRAAPELRLLGARILAAVEMVAAVGPHTPDLGGRAATRDVTAAVITALNQAIAARPPATAMPAI